MKCVNHSHPDYKDLNNRYPNRLILDFIISKYQEANNTEDFPSEDHIKTEYERPASYFVQNSDIIALRKIEPGKVKRRKGQLVVYKSGTDVVKRSNKAITETVVYDINRIAARELLKQYKLSGKSITGILESYEAGTASKKEQEYVRDLMSSKTYPYGRREQFNTKLAESIQRAVRQWRDRAKSFRKKGSIERAETVERRVGLITDDLVYDLGGISIDGININDLADLPIELLGNGLIKFFKDSNEDIEDVLKLAQDYIDGKQEVNRSTLVKIAEHVAYYRPFVEELRGIIEREEIPIINTTLTDLRALIEDAANKFSKIKSFKDELRKNEVGIILDEILAEELGIDSTEPNFRELVKQKLEYDPYSDVENTDNDISTFSTWFGPIKDTSDQLLRVIHKKLYKLNQRIYNASLEYGKDIVNKFTDIAFKDTNWMAERDNRKFTGYFISPFKRAAFNKHKDEFFKNLWDKYGLSHNENDRLLQIANDLTDDKVLAYKKEEKDWYQENTQPLQNIDMIIADLEDTFDQATVELWKNKHRVYNKGYKGFLVPSNKWKNPAWDKLSSAQKDQLSRIIEEKRKIDLEIHQVLKKNIDPFKMVQVSAPWSNIIMNSKQDMFRRLGKNMKEVTIKKAEDTDIFGEASTLRPDGSFQRNIPVRWVEPLEDPDSISTDVVGSLIIYNEMWTNFKMKAEELPDFALLEEQISERNFINEKNQIKKGIDTNSFEKLRTFLDMNISDMRKSQLEVDFLGRKINMTKVLETFSSYVRANNLVNAFFTMGSNFVSSKVFSWIEVAVAEYTTKKSYAFANREYYKNLPGLMQEFAAKTTTSNNKLRLLLEYSQLTGRLGDMFGDLNLNKLSRAAVKSGLYWGYELGDMFVKSKILLSVLDNHRFYKGSLITYQDFQKLNVDTDFFSLESAYDQIHVSNGKLVYEFSENDFLNMTAKAKALADSIDGQMSQEDRSAIHQHAVFSMAAIHRNWLFSGIYKRFKRKGYNFMMGTIDEGYFRTTHSLILNTFFSRDRVNSIKELLLVWDELKPYQKKAVLRTMYEMGMVLFFAMTAYMINSFDDEDEDRWTVQAAAYLSNRALLEVSAFVNPGEYINVLKDPFVPARNIEYMMDLTEIFNTDEITKGPWEGYSHRERFFYRMLPGYKGLTMTYNPEYSNQFLKQKPLKWLY